MIRALALILMALGTGASAQALPVRSGEHGGYTRLVVRVPPGTEWVLDQRQNGASLTIGIDDVTFDTRAVFGRLSGNRLKSLDQPEPGAALDMAFGCECIATAFLHRQTMVVVDIAPGSLAPSEVSLTPALSANSAAKPSLPAELPTSELALPLLQLNHRAFEDQLMARILQGADRQVVDLQLAGVGRRHSTGFGPLRAGEEPAPNLRLSSVLDDVRGLGNLAIPQLDTPPVCIADSEIGLATWSTSQPFSTQLAGLRVGLFQEFDRIDRARALKLAKLYIHFGFGAEAREVLNLLPEPATNHDMLSAIAYAMDGLPVPAPNLFEGQQRCDGAAAFWALMTEGALHQDAQLNVIEQTFGRLPQHLRRQLGPALADLLVAADRLEASRRILRAVERVLDTHSADVTLAKAAIATAAGDADTAETLLTEVAKTPAAAKEAPLALARLVEKRWSDRGAISPRDLDLAAGYAREFRRSELGPMMARTHVLALALSQDFDGALGRLADAPGTEDWRRTQDQVLHLLAERADDITFLRHVLGLPAETRGAVAVQTAIAVAERLADLGFSAPIHALANRPRDRERRFDRARLRARAALLDGQPRQALLELADDPSKAARKLRAQAMMRTQDHEATARLLHELGAVEAADRYAWLAGTDGGDAEASNAFTDLTRITALLAEPAERQPDRPLADAAGLLQDSATARARIADMLDIVRGNEPN